MIPEWNNAGILPPIWPGMQGHSNKRSPYIVNIEELIATYAFNTGRRVILNGLLDYRKALYQIGITKGFQWIDGSFIENIESLENRKPNDVDVVTFFHMPDGMEQQKLQQVSSLFEPAYIKKNYCVDGYACLLGQPMESYSIKQISYWYSMWSHRRDGLWKGFLQVDLSPFNDELAREVLHQRGLS